MRFDISLLTLAALVVPALAAKTWDVNFVNGKFSPQNITIAPGDSVRWPNTDGSHAIAETNSGAASCNSKAGGFNSGTKAKGQAYERSFPTATTVNYKDGVGANCVKGAIGTIYVGTKPTAGSGSGSTATHPVGTKTAAPITKPSNAASVLSTQKSIVLGAACVVGALIL